MADHRLIATLRVLIESNIDFILVGGLSAVVNGAPLQTFDVDIVHSRGAENVAQILGVLDALDAIFRMQPERRLKPNASHLSSSGHQNLLTRYGPLDLLGTIGDRLGYQELLPHSAEVEIGEGLRIHVLNLETLIQLKEQLGGEKDLAMLPILRRTLEESQKKSRE